MNNPEPDLPPKSDCYSGGERKFMEWGQQMRGKALLPILILLQKAKIKPDHLTLISFITGILSAFLLPFFPVTALIFLLAHVLFDGMDGPLARHLGIASNRGSFTDTMSDQAVVFAITLSVIFIGHAHPIAAITFATLYTSVIAFSMVRNALEIPYSWLVRPRFFFYLYIPIELWIFPHTLDYLLWVCNILLALKTLTGFMQIRKKL